MILAYIARVCCLHMLRVCVALVCLAQAGHSYHAMLNRLLQHIMHNTVCALQFENDVFSDTSEPHGDIEAVVTRKDAMPHARL